VAITPQKADNKKSMKKILIVMTALLASMAAAQTTTTNTDCTVFGSNVSCSSTSHDDSAARAAQAETDRQGYEMGKSMGNAVGGGILALRNKHAINKQYKAYCGAHPGETWPRRDSKGTVLDQGVCPGNLTRQQVIDDLNKSFQDQKVVGYTEIADETFTMHSERASEMRFHMVLDKQMLGVFHTIGIKTFVYTNDKDQKYVYDVAAGHVVTPRAPSAPAAAPSAATEAEPLAPAASSATVTKAVASTLPPSVPAVAPAAPAPAAVPTKSCDNAFWDKSGHEVCLDQH
jgi:hypothetical protein